MPGQIAKLVPATSLKMPGVVDSNSPSHWADGTLVVFNSDGLPIRSEGTSIEDLGRTRAVRLYSYENVPLWIEATHRKADGTLYAWYHHEVFLHCEDNPVSAPEIGALRSDDNGITFHDLGIILSAAGEMNCETKNRYFGGGNGDFSAIADQSGEFIYFLYSNYSGDVTAQGVATARLRMEDLDDPAGMVFKYFDGRWEEPGLGGRESPIFRASSSWASESADSLWGPSIHWNTYLKKYVMVMNYTCCSTDWPQAGIYLSYSSDLSRPEMWQQPVLLMSGGGWYPMVMGIGEGETDKLAGKTARFFMGSDSDWLIEFEP
ncbi:MAG: hypothetical protein NTW74_16385 [Acidobacteria bacterium]|nr:hypothetical protein [Acidobacteriota bacterium]